MGCFFSFFIMDNLPSAIRQSKPKGDIVALAYILIIACVVQIFVGFVLIAIAIALPNNDYLFIYLPQWTFAFLAVCFPFFGILGAWKALLSSLIFSIYLGFQLAWNIIYIILLGLYDTGVAHRVVHIIFAGIEIVLAIVLLVISTAMNGLLVNYYR